jgi:AmmeMemoRadiSam system protein A
VLCDTALAAIEYGLDRGRPPDLDVADFAEELRSHGASFVTVRNAGALRGCTGTLQPTRPLVEDVSHNAWRSANEDSRFAPVRRSELPELDIHVSVLSPLSPLPVSSKAQLLRELRPGRDGLVVRDGGAVATFLPTVWEQLPSADRFVSELLAKAGLPRDHWSDTISFERYSAEELCAEELD